MKQTHSTLGMITDRKQSCCNTGNGPIHKRKITVFWGMTPCSLVNMYVEEPVVHLYGDGVRQGRKWEYKFVEQEAINSLTVGTGPEEGEATERMVLSATQRWPVPPQSWHFFIRLQLSHPRRHQQVFINMAISNLIWTIRLEQTMFIIIHLNTDTNSLTGSGVL
jgi:hypothetical protein